MLFTEGKFHFNKFTPEGLQTAIECFEGALKEDPNYATALAGKARCKVLLGTLYLGPRVTHPEARELFLKVLQIDPNLADAHAGLGTIHLFHDWDWPAAERELKLASANSGWLAWNIYGFWLAAHSRLRRPWQASSAAKKSIPRLLPAGTSWPCATTGCAATTRRLLRRTKRSSWMRSSRWRTPQLGLAHVQQGTARPGHCRIANGHRRRPAASRCRRHAWIRLCDGRPKSRGPKNNSAA